jgi:hypothetical protein
MRPDSWPAAAFGQLGLQFDVELERRSLRAIPKLAAIFDEVDRVALLEVAFSHYAVADASASVVFPDGGSITAARAAELGWVDAICQDDAEIRARLGALLDLVATGRSSQIPADGERRPAAELSAGSTTEDVIEAVLDEGSLIRFSEAASGTLVAGIAAVAGTTVGFVGGEESGAADRARLAKASLLCGTLALPLLFLSPGVQRPFAALRIALAGDWPRPAAAIVLAGADGVSPGPFDLPVYALSWSSDGAADARVRPADTRACVAALLQRVVEPARRRNPPAEEQKRVRADVSGAPIR